MLRYCIAQYNNCISGFNFVTSRLFSTLSLPWTLQTYVESATTKSLVTQQFFFVKVQFSQRRLIILRKKYISRCLSIHLIHLPTSIPPPSHALCNVCATFNSPKDLNHSAKLFSLRMDFPLTPFFVE